MPEARPAASEGSSAAAAQQTDFQGAEKRRRPRYTEGSAEMCAASCEVRTWATFTDISLHSCYVEAQATYPVGSVLRLKLEAKGLRIEAVGNARVTYPYLGMGIAFVEMTDENRAPRKEMLASISRPTMVMGPGIAGSFPALGPLEMPAISDPRAALPLIDFFEDRPSLNARRFPAHPPSEPTKHHRLVAVASKNPKRCWEDVSLRPKEHLGSCKDGRIRRSGGPDLSGRAPPGIFAHSL